MAARRPGQHADLVLVGERLAELGEQMRRRLDARPVVLVDDEQAGLGGVGHGGRTLPSTPMEGAALRILFAAPAWWPAVAFGGPIPVTRELSERLAAHGHGVSVVTTTLVDLHSRPAAKTRTETRGGVRVTYLATPAELPLDGHHAVVAGRSRAARATRRRARPRVSRSRVDRRRGVGARSPNPLRLRAARDVRAPPAQGRAQARASTRRSTVGSPAARPPWSSARSARRDTSGRAACGSTVCAYAGTAFPIRSRCLRAAACCAASSRFPKARRSSLYVGRIASGKGIEHLLSAVRELPDLQLVLVGPDDRHGAIDEVRAAHSIGTRARARADRRAAAAPLQGGRRAAACRPKARASAWPPPRPPRPGRPSSSPTAAASRASSGKARRSSCRMAQQSSPTPLRRVLGDERATPVARGRRHRRGAPDVLGARDGAPGRDLPRSDRLAAGLDEGLDGRLVAPRPRELARARAVRAAQLRVCGEAAERGRSRSVSPYGTRTPFSPSRRRSAAAPTRSESTSGRPDAAASLTADAPGLVRGQQREDVGGNVCLRDAIGGKLTREHGVGRNGLEARPLGPRADEHRTDSCRRQTRGA